MTALRGMHSLDSVISEIPLQPATLRAMQFRKQHTVQKDRQAQSRYSRRTQVLPIAGGSIANNNTIIQHAILIIGKDLLSIYVCFRKFDTEHLFLQFCQQGRLQFTFFRPGRYVITYFTRHYLTFQERFDIIFLIFCYL